MALSASRAIVGCSGLFFATWRSAGVFDSASVSLVGQSLSFDRIGHLRFLADGFFDERLADHLDESPLQRSAVGGLRAMPGRNHPQQAVFVDAGTQARPDQRLLSIVQRWAGQHIEPQRHAATALVDVLPTGSTASIKREPDFMRRNHRPRCNAKAFGSVMEIVR